MNITAEVLEQIGAQKIGSKYSHYWRFKDLNISQQKMGTPERTVWIVASAGGRNFLEVATVADIIAAAWTLGVAHGQNAKKTEISDYLRELIGIKDE